MKRWFANVYVLIVITISLVGICMSALLFLLIPSPDEIVRQAQGRFTELDSYRADIDVRYRGTRQTRDGVEPESYLLHIDTFRETAASDDTDSTDGFSLAVDQEDGGQLVFEGRRNRLGRAQFYRFTMLPDRIGAVRLDELRNRDLRIDLPRVLGLTDLALVGTGRHTLDDLSRAELRRDFRLTPFVAVTEKFEAERLGGKEAHHFKVRPEILFFRGFFALAESLRLGRELTDAERSKIETRFADITAEDGEIWIGKRDRLPLRLRGRFRLDDGVRRGTLDVTIELSRFNEPVAVEAPGGEVSDTTSFLESLLLGLREQLPLARIGAGQRAETTTDTGLPVAPRGSASDDPDNDGLSNLLESFYLTNASDADTDDDGVSDGDEISQGRNPSGPGMLFDFGLSR